MKAETLKAAGIPFSGSGDVAVLQAEAALDWMQENTTLQFDKADTASLEALPACAKLFVAKYCEAISLREGVASQSIEGLSMSFDTTNKAALLYQIATNLLGPYLKSQVRVMQARRRW